MQFKRSAGLFVAGVTLVVFGPLLSGAASWLWAYLVASGRDTGMAAVYIAFIVFGGLLGLVGFCLLVVSIHRALEKIDALPARAQQRQSEYASS